MDWHGVYGWNEAVPERAEAREYFGAAALELGVQQHGQEAVRGIGVAFVGGGLFDGGFFSGGLFAVGGGALLLLAQGDLNDVFQGVAVEDVGDGVADIDHEHAEAAVGLIRAGAFFILGLAGAADGGELAVDEADDVAHDDGFHGLGQAGAAILAAHAFDITGGAQLEEDGFKEFEGQVLLLGQGGDGDDAFLLTFGNAEAYQGAQCIFSAFGQSHKGNMKGYAHRASRNGFFWGGR